MIPRVDDNLLAHPGALAVVVVALLLALAGGIGIGVKAWRSFHVAWTPLPWWIPGCARGGTAVDTGFLLAALQRSQDLLIAKTHFTAADFAKTGPVKIFVMPEKSWLDGAGVKVAGVQIDNVLEVGPDLAALCHEYAHLLEDRIDQKVDDAHAGWAANGIQAAINGFDAWRAAR